MDCSGAQIGTLRLRRIADRGSRIVFIEADGRFRSSMTDSSGWIHLRGLESPRRVSRSVLSRRTGWPRAEEVCCASAALAVQTATSRLRGFYI